MKKPDNLFFRVRENGASVYRVDTENRQRRLELQQIANLNVRNGEVKPQGDHELSDAERESIDTWLVSRRRILADRQADDLRRAIDHLSYTAHWIQSKATDEQIEEFSDDLLMAMHDLRTVIVRKKSDAQSKK